MSTNPLLFFDTETTGIPRWDLPADDFGGAVKGKIAKAIDAYLAKAAKVKPKSDYPMIDAIREAQI